MPHVRGWMPRRSVRHERHGSNGDLTVTLTERERRAIAGALNLSEWVGEAGRLDTGRVRELRDRIMQGLEN